MHKLRQLKEKISLVCDSQGVHSSPTYNIHKMCTKLFFMDSCFITVLLGFHVVHSLYIPRKMHCISLLNVIIIGGYLLHINKCSSCPWRTLCIGGCLRCMKGGAGYIGQRMQAMMRRMMRKGRCWGCRYQSTLLDLLSTSMCGIATNGHGIQILFLIVLCDVHNYYKGMGGHESNAQPHHGEFFQCKDQIDAL